MRRLRDCGLTLIISKDLVGLLPIKGYGFILVECFTSCFGVVDGDVKKIHVVWSHAKFSQLTFRCSLTFFRNATHGISTTFGLTFLRDLQGETSWACSTVNGVRYLKAR